MDKDLRKLFKALEDAGYEVSRNRRGHYEVRQDGRKITTFAGTGSDWRGFRNALAPLKRQGFTWPPKR